MNVDLHCLNCDNSRVFVRTSEKVGLRTIQITAICHNCQSKMDVMAEIIRLQTPTYTERPEALRLNKVLAQVDTNQGELFTGDDKPAS